MARDKRKRCNDDKDVRMHDDGCKFICMNCGVIVNRTRFNPYPEVPHKYK